MGGELFYSETIQQVISCLGALSLNSGTGRQVRAAVHSRQTMTFTLARDPKTACQINAELHYTLNTKDIQGAVHKVTTPQILVVLFNEKDTFKIAFQCASIIILFSFSDMNKRKKDKILYSMLLWL